MYLLLIAIILIILFILEKFLKKNKQSPEDNTLPYSLNKNILTKRELEFYKTLKPIADKHNLVVIIKIRLADFVTCTDKNNFYKWFNKIKSKHIDFLLCGEELEPKFGIELDDSTHSKPKRIERDILIDNIYKTIGLRITHVNNYSKESLENIFSEPTAS